MPHAHSCHYWRMVHILKHLGVSITASAPPSKLHLIAFVWLLTVILTLLYNAYPLKPQSMVSSVFTHFMSQTQYQIHGTDRFSSQIGMESAPTGTQFWFTHFVLSLVVTFEDWGTPQTHSQLVFSPFIGKFTNWSFWWAILSSRYPSN